MGDQTRGGDRKEQSSSAAGSDRTGVKPQSAEDKAGDKLRADSGATGGQVGPRFSVTNHKLITEDALIAEGLNEASRFGIEVGNLAQDLDSQTRGTPTDHFDDNRLAGSLQGISQHDEKIATLLKKQELTADDETAILYEFGQKLHTIQDFYAHSNYVELHLKDNPKSGPSDVPLMDWEQIRKEQTDPVRTGFYYYQNSVQNEGIEFWMSRDGVINHLEELGEKVPNTQYLPSSQYIKLRSFQDRINYFADPKYSVLHQDINKDSDTSDEGKVVNPSTHDTLYQYARNLTLRETQKQWHDLESTVHTLRPNDSAQVMNQLKNMSFSGALAREQWTIDGIITRMIMTEKKK